MITLYQLHWSHFVEVRWALDYKGIEWSAVDVDPFTKQQMRHLRCQTTPRASQPAVALGISKRGSRVPSSRAS